MTSPRSIRQPEPGERGRLVVFLVWPALPYPARMVGSMLLVAGGVVAQMLAGSFLLGVAPVLLGNLLLLVRGYDNRVDNKQLSPAAQWQRVGREKLDEIVRLDKGIRRWDRSLIDITSSMGVVSFLVVGSLLGLGVLVIGGFGRVLVLDAMLLLLPHWFTGIRRVLRLPKVVIRARILTHVLDAAGDMIKDDKVQILMLLTGKEVQMPDDIKFQLTFQEQDPEFLGLYGQVVINEVQGRSYPYFYTVLVAKQGYGLSGVSEGYSPSNSLDKKYDTDAEVEFIVLRQKTTKTSGYHTKDADALMTFIAGYELARKAVTGETGS